MKLSQEWRVELELKTFNRPSILQSTKNSPPNAPDVLNTLHNSKLTSTRIKPLTQMNGLAGDLQKLARRKTITER